MIVFIFLLFCLCTLLSLLYHWFTSVFVVSNFDWNAVRVECFVYLTQFIRIGKKPTTTKKTRPLSGTDIMCVYGIGMVCLCTRHDGTQFTVSVVLINSLSFSQLIVVVILVLSLIKNVKKQNQIEPINWTFRMILYLEWSEYYFLNSVCWKCNWFEIQSLLEKTVDTYGWERKRTLALEKREMWSSIIPMTRLMISVWNGL